MSSFADAYQNVLIDGSCCLKPNRILNRFTKDLHFMDDLLPMTMYDFTVCSFMVVGGTLIVFVVNPWVVLRSVVAQDARLTLCNGVCSSDTACVTLRCGC